MGVLFSNVKQLAVTHQPNEPLRGEALAAMPVIENAFLYIEKDLIKDFGKMSELLHANYSIDEVIDASGKIILPAWCDSHTHLVFAGSRENEFVDKIKGLSYAEIAARGGGILNSAARLQSTPEDELYEVAAHRLRKLIRLGTGAIEIKSGYGLNKAAELKMLRVIKRLKENFPIPVKATFLGAHAIPGDYANKREEYIEEVIAMIPDIAAEGLADYIDVFCEKNFFTVEETIKICRAGMDHGLQPKIHANQLHVSGGVEAGVALNAVSVDHLESMDENAVQTLANSSTIGTLLPTAAYFLRMPFQPARRLIDAGCAIAIASDFNPGSSPSGNMNIVVSMSCIQMKMLPEESIQAATINGAFAMGLQEAYGSIAKGKQANFILTEPIPSYQYLPYSFGFNHIESVYINGELYS